MQFKIVVFYYIHFLELSLLSQDLIPTWWNVSFQVANFEIQKRAQNIQIVEVKLMQEMIMLHGICQLAKFC